MKVSQECSHKCARVSVNGGMLARLCMLYTVVPGKCTNNLEHVLVKLTVYILRRENVSGH